jgi:hypothetical protein
MVVLPGFSVNRRSYPVNLFSVLMQLLQIAVQCWCGVLKTSKRIAKNNITEVKIGESQKRRLMRNNLPSRQLGFAETTR